MSFETKGNDHVDTQIITELTEIRKHLRVVQEHIGFCKGCAEKVTRLISIVEGNSGEGVKQKLVRVESRLEDHSEQLATFSRQKTQTRTAMIAAGASVVVALLALLGVILSNLMK